MPAQPNPNFERLDEIIAQADAAIAAGTWTREVYEKALAEAEKALDGWEEGLECIVNRGLSEWDPD